MLGLLLRPNLHFLIDKSFEGLARGIFFAGNITKTRGWLSGFNAKAY
jgi:hypothetical protein